MNKCPTVALGDVAAIERNSVQPNEIESGTFYVGLENIESGGRFIQVGTVEAGVLASSKFRFSEKHVLYGKLRPYLAKIACPDFDGICSTDIVPILPGPKIDRGYLFHFLRQPSMIEFANSRTVGINLPRLSPSTLQEFQIPLPEPAAQRRIAEVLDRAEALQAKRRAALAQLDTLTSSIFLDLSQKSQSELREYELSDLAVAERGAFVNGPFGSNLLTSELKDDGVPVIYIRDIRDGEYKRVSTAFISERKARDLAVCSVIPGDVLVAKVGDPPGVAAVYPNHEPLAVVTQDVIRIRAAADRVLPEFLAAFLNSSLGRHKISHITIQATRARFSLGRFKQTTIPLPPVNIQGQFVRAASAIEKLRTFHRSALKEVESLIVALQARAFRGELFAPSGVLSELAAGVP